MTTEHQATREEDAFGQLLEEKWEMLSLPARAVLEEAQSTAYGAYMVRSYGFQPEEYDEALEKMRWAAAKLTDHQHYLLAKLWRTALAAAASIDADDFETFVGHRVHRGDLHGYYRMVSRMIERTLQEKKLAEPRKERATKKTT